MPTQKSEDQKQGKWTIEDVYNMLMVAIEPELTTHLIPELDDMYSDETPEEHEERIERYTYAFSLFNDRFNILMNIWKDQAKELHQKFLANMQSKALQEDAKEILDLEHSIEANDT